APKTMMSRGVMPGLSVVSAMPRSMIRRRIWCISLRTGFVAGEVGGPATGGALRAGLGAAHWVEAASAGLATADTVIGPAGAAAASITAPTPDTSHRWHLPGATAPKACRPDGRT